MTREMADDWPEAALLSLGRILELWLLLSLGMEERNYSLETDIIREAELSDLIYKHERSLLIKIRRQYNDLKHKTYFKIDKSIILVLIEEFSHLFKEMDSTPPILPEK